MMRIGLGRRLLALGLPTAWGAAAIGYKLACPLAEQSGLGARIVTSAVFLAVGTGLVHQVRRGPLRELKRVRKVAGEAQDALLRPLPPRVGGLDVAAVRFSADRGAAMGGDLYEVVATEYGVRAVVGDVRGHGIAAFGTVSAVLGSFREAAHDEPGLDRVLRRLDRALARHLREQSTEGEDFVTVLLLEIGRDGRVRALNCGHPWPYRLRGTGVVPLARADPLPPLGLFPLPDDELTAVSCGRLRPGEALFLYTDGAADARDGHGRFFPLETVLAEALRQRPPTPQMLVGAVFTRLLRHTAGRPADDVALLVLADEGPRRRRTGAPDTVRPAATHPRPTVRG
ncbi:MAG: serine/threonine-protein phosphatase [Streptomyces sp.]|nr:serine/threonine-protein phosphatase [Streptomyces sp.]